MKQYPQCMMCKYSMGRSCTLTNSVVKNEIYNNEVKCSSFKSIQDEDSDVNDSCCSESIRFEEQMKSHEA